MTRKEMVTQKLNKTLPLVREYLMILSNMIDTGEISSEREYELVCNRLDDYTDKFNELSHFIMDVDYQRLYSINPEYLTEYAYLFLSNRYRFDVEYLPHEEQNIIKKLSLGSQSKFLYEVIFDSDIRYSDFLICLMLIVRDKMA